jgi:hypothetical protein
MPLIMPRNASTRESPDATQTQTLSEHSTKVRVIALTPPAREAPLRLPEREGPVFLSKSGGRLCAPLLSNYWREVQAAAGLRSHSGRLRQQTRSRGRSET